MLSSALAELVVVSTVEKNSAKKGIKKKDEQDVTETWEERQISGTGEGVQKKVIESASHISASGKEVELDEKEEPKNYVAEALLVLEKIQIKEKSSLEDVKGMESEQVIGEIQDVSKDTYMESVELSKETLLLKKKMFWCMRLRFL